MEKRILTCEEDIFHTFGVMNSLPEFYNSNWIAEQAWFGERFLTGMNTIPFPNQQPLAPTDIYDNFNLPTLYQNTSWCQHAHLYAIYRQPFVDFVYENVNAFSGHNQWYFVMAAMGLIDYIGYSTDKSKHICIQHKKNYNTLLRRYCVEYTEVSHCPAKYRTWFVQERKYAGTNLKPLYTTMLVKLNKLIPEPFIRTLECGANSLPRLITLYKERFINEDIEWTHKDTYKGNPGTRALIKFVLDMCKVGYPSLYIIQGVGLMFAKNLVIKVLAGQIHELEAPNPDDGDFANPFLPFAVQQ